MKLKLTKPKTIIYKLLLCLVLIASSIAVNITIADSQVHAAMSFNQLKEKINTPMRNYCAPVKGDNYTKCTGHYTAGAAAVYNASSEKEVNNQLRTICTPPIQNWVLNGSASDCGAFAEGVTTSQGILGKTHYNGGGSQGGSGGGSQGGGGGGSQGGTGGGSQQDKPPPITECNKIKNKEKRNECRRKYQACNPPPETHAAAKACKRRIINEYTGGQAGLGCQTEAGSDECRPTGDGGQQEEPNPYEGKYLCGNIRTENNGTEGPLSDDNYYTKFNFGCVGEEGPPGLNPIEDLAFAGLRFLSVGVGIAVVLAIVGSGIQYTMSEGNAEVTGKAKKRIRSAVIGLAVYIFAFSLFQYLVPGGIFWPGNWLDVELITRLL